MMIEAGASERVFELIESGAKRPERGAPRRGHRDFEGATSPKSIALQEELVELAGKPKATVGDDGEYQLFADYSDEIFERVKTEAEAGIAEAITITSEGRSSQALCPTSARMLRRSWPRISPSRGGQISEALRSLTKKLVRKRIVEENVRLDGRSVDQVRPIWTQVGVLPRVHGSGVFTRGETQALSIATLGMARMEQIIDDLGTDDRKRYMHHYNFPPYSTGEAGFMRGPKRREIGHGALAEKSILPIVPSKDEFPYTIRIVSEILSSNGSTSMASVCGSSLALMDGGVPVRGGKHVGGVAMGLVAEGGKFLPLTDILGDEDAFGDMDFKVAGTEEVVTALQLDTKISGVPAEVLARH